MGDYQKKMKIDLDMGNNQILGLVPEVVDELPTTNLTIGRLVVYSGSMYICTNPDETTVDKIWRVFSATSSSTSGLTEADIGSKVAGLTADRKLIQDNIPNIPQEKVTGLETSLNSKLENVKFNGANLAITDKAVEIPKDLAQYDNTTSDFASKTFVKDQIGAIKHFKVEVVDELPSTGDDNTIYFVPQAGGSGQNVKDEYMWIEGKWELIGTTEFSLNIVQDADGITINDVTLQDASSTQDGLMTKAQAVEVGKVASKADKSYVDGTFITKDNQTSDVAKGNTKVVTSGGVFEYVSGIEATKVNVTTTVNGHALSGNVTVTKADVGLGKVENLAPADLPVSTATQTALDGKVDKLATKPTAGTYAKVTINAEGQVTAGQAKIAIADISDFPTLLSRYTADITGNGTTKAFSVPTDSITDISSVMVLDKTDGSEVITGMKIASDKVEIGFNKAPATGENYTVVIIAKPKSA